MHAKILVIAAARLLICACLVGCAPVPRQASSPGAVDTLATNPPAVTAGIPIARAVFKQAYDIQSPYRVGVNGLADAAFDSKRKYILASAKPNVTIDDLEFKECATYLKVGLSLAGYTEVSDPDKYQALKKADMMIVFNYDDSKRLMNGEFKSVLCMRVVAVDKDSYFKENKHIDAWSIDVVNGGPGYDIRQMMPVFVAAATPYFGKSTKETLVIEISDSDSLLQKIRTGN
jgi:hypothetical protein